eukprot:5891821-Alexandrium_andersonii.AAC.1
MRLRSSKRCCGWCFAPRSALLSAVPTAMQLISPLFWSACSQSVLIAKCLMRPTPSRFDSARAALLSQCHLSCTA